MISVIIPVYNVEKWLERCVESVLAQTYRNIEVILVNDGSSDHSLEICYKYQRSDARVIVISQENQGLSAARNAGIMTAKGEYITFLDADDYLARDIIEKVRLKIAGSDICIFQYIGVNENDYDLRLFTQNPLELTMTNKEVLEKLFADDGIGGVIACGKVYRKKLFVDNDIYFPVGKYHEDCFTTYKLFYASKTVKYIPDVGYYYFQRDDSIMHRKFNVKHLDKIEAADECIEYILENEPEMGAMCKAFCMRWYLQVINKMIRSKYRDKKIFSTVKNKLKEMRFWRNPYVRVKYKILFSMFLCCDYLYQVVLLILKKEG